MNGICPVDQGRGAAPAFLDHAERGQRRGCKAGFACSADHDERLQIDDAILDFDDLTPRRSTRVLDAGDNPHRQHLAVSSGRQARRRTFVPRKTTALAAFHPTRQGGRRGCQFPAARTWVRGAWRTPSRQRSAIVTQQCHNPTAALVPPRGYPYYEKPHLSLSSQGVNLQRSRSRVIVPTPVQSVPTTGSL